MMTTSGKKVERYTLALDVETKRVLARIACETQRPISTVVRELVEKGLLDWPMPHGVTLPRKLAARKAKAAKAAKALATPLT